MYPVSPLLFRHGGIIRQSHSPSCRRLTPFGTGGHGDPNRGTLPGEPTTKYVTDDFPSLFPLLSFSYLISPSLCLRPFPFLFLWGSLPASPFSGNDLAPEKQPRGDGPKHSRPGRQVVYHSGHLGRHFALRLEDCVLLNWHLRRDTHYPVYAIGLIVCILSS